ncbi:unnamed protein product [Moneuplotes crassus]|uniref:Uncharacterized protein n=1 Tax=Euplotes crassus TaxID=5936 RepID=A0AAD1URI2_EUPCR|nr:unnamed protein product [Moneuplotes crassus]
MENERLKKVLDSQLKRQEQLKHFEEEKVRNLQQIRDHKKEKLKMNQERIFNNKMAQMRRLKNLSQMINKKQKKATIYRNSSNLVDEKQRRDALRTQRLQRNLKIQKQKQMDLKMKVLEKEKMGEYRLAKSRHDKAKAKKVLSELLWMKNRDRNHSNSLVGLLTQRRHTRHRSLHTFATPSNS